MRHGSWIRQTALAALMAGVILSIAALSSRAADGVVPLRIKFDVTDGKTCPPSNARTELRLRVPGGAWAQSPSAVQSQSNSSAAVALLSYCPAGVESRCVVRTACYLGEEPGETQTLTATMQRAAQPMPIRGKLAPPRPAAKQATAVLFSAEQSK
jgi:hypothetical protein